MYKIKNIVRVVLLSLLPILLFTSCSYHKIPMTLQTGTNDFQSLVSRLVDESASKIKKRIMLDDVVLVSDFVNLDKLHNRSELGFLLSDILKDKLSSLDIIIREVEFRREFVLGKSGFNLLSRDKTKIVKDVVDKARYAVVGTYSITSKSLNVFIKLIDIQTGNILSSSYERTDIDEEILGLEGADEKKAPAVRPHVVL
jgi:TolB-like protein